jgi:hypothetical protein
MEDIRTRRRRRRRGLNLRRCNSATLLDLLVRSNHQLRAMSIRVGRVVRSAIIIARPMMVVPILLLLLLLPIRRAIPTNSNHRHSEEMPRLRYLQRNAIFTDRRMRFLLLIPIDLLRLMDSVVLAPAILLIRVVAVIRNLRLRNTILLLIRIGVLLLHQHRALTMRCRLDRCLRRMGMTRCILVL